MKYYTFSTTIGGNTTKEAWDTFMEVLEEYKAYRAFEIKEKKNNDRCFRFKIIIKKIQSIGQ